MLQKLCKLLKLLSNLMPLVYLQQCLRLYYSISMSGLDEYMNRHMPFINEIMADNICALPRDGQKIARHITNLPGKGLRPALLVLTAGSLGFNFAKNNYQVYALCAAIEFIHCASLLHDDMEDEAPIRRGQNAAHTVFGAKGTLLAGDAMLALANTLAARQGNSEIIVCLSEGILNTVCGQIQGLTQTEDLSAYIQTILLKTGSLMSVSCKLGAILAKANPKLCGVAAELGSNLGIAFQLADDWLDFFPSQLTGKAMASDLRQGNFTLPIHFYTEMLSGSEKENFHQKFISGQFNEQETKHVCEAVRCSQIQDKMLNFSEKYLGLAQKSVAHFPDGLEKRLVEQLITKIRLKFRGHKCPQK